MSRKQQYSLEPAVLVCQLKSMEYSSRRSSPFGGTEPGDNAPPLNWPVEQKTIKMAQCAGLRAN